MKELKDRDNLDLFQLICQLAGRYALYNNETLHDAFFEAKNEFEKRLKALESERDELKELQKDGNVYLRQGKKELQTLKEAVKEVEKCDDSIMGISMSATVTNKEQMADAQERKKKAEDKLKTLIK